MRATFIQVFLNGSKGKKDLSQYVEKLKFEDCTDKDSMVRITFKSEYALIVLADKEFTTGTVIAFQFGFIQGSISPVHLAKIADVEATYSGIVELEVTALSASNDMKKVDSKRVFTKMTSKQIVTEIAAKYNLKVQVDDSKKVWDNLPQGNMSDYDFLQSLAGKEDGGNYVCYVKNNTVNFVRKGLNKKSSATYTIGTSKDIIRFKTKLKASGHHGKHATRVSLDSVNSSTKVSSTSSVTNSNEKKAISLGDYKFVYDGANRKIGTTDGATIFKGMQSGLTFAKDVGKNLVSPSEDDDENEDAANSLKKFGNNKVLTGDLDLVGNPFLQPNTVITMNNVAERHKGNWFVKKVTHDVSAEYKTSLELTKPASTDDQVNKTKGPEQVDRPKVVASVYTSNLGKIAERQDDDQYVVPKVPLQ